jgi:hypothetical protein
VHGPNIGAYDISKTLAERAAWDFVADGAGRPLGLRAHLSGRTGQEAQSDNGWSAVACAGGRLSPGGRGAGRAG